MDSSNAFLYERKVSTSPIRSDEKWIQEIYLPKEKLACNIASNIFGVESLNVFENDGSIMKQKRCRITPGPHLTDDEIEKLKKTMPSLFEPKVSVKNIKEVHLNPEMIEKIKTIAHQQLLLEKSKSELKEELKTFINLF